MARKPLDLITIYHPSMVLLWLGRQLHRHQARTTLISVGLLAVLAMSLAWYAGWPNVLGLARAPQSKLGQDTAAIDPQSHPTLLPSEETLDLSLGSEDRSAELADDFPSDVPIYPGVITNTSRSVVAGHKAWTLTVASTVPINQTVREIQASLEEIGWHKDSELVDDQGVTFGVSKDQRSIVIYVSSARNQTEVNYTVTEQATSHR